MLNDMKEKGVIEESDGPWSSPVALVRKKNGDLRFCVDYSKLNDVTKEAYLGYACRGQVVLEARPEEWLVAGGTAPR
jgi:hypothetical protein